MPRAKLNTSHAVWSVSASSSSAPPAPPALHQAGEVLRPAAVVRHAYGHQPSQLQRLAGASDVLSQAHSITRRTAVL
jgi:hypothetical protein